MSTTLSGSVKDLSTAAVTSNTILRFILRGTNGAIPRVNGTALVAQNPTPYPNLYYFDFTPDSSGNFSGTLYSTRDASGTGNGDIEVGGSLTAVWYGMVLIVSGQPGPELPVHAKNGATLDPSNETPITTTPVSTAPTGDTTYLRLDAGNISSSINPYPFPGVLAAATGFRRTGGTHTAGRVLRANGTNFVDAVLAAADLSDGTNGTGSISMSNSPAFVTPSLGAATATSINGLHLASSTGTLSITNGKTLAASASLTLAGTDGTTPTFPNNNGNVAELNFTQTWTALQTLGSGLLSATDPTFPGNTLFKRSKATQGSALVTGDVGSLSAGWGTTATVSAVSGTDAAGSITISSSGTGQSANPTFVLTFHDGTWTNSPIVIVVRADFNAPVGGAIHSGASATTVQFAFNGLPVAGSSYTFHFICIGR